MTSTSHDTDPAVVLHVYSDAAAGDVFGREIEDLTDFSVVSVNGVTEGIEVLDRREDVACVVSDYDVPDIDGLTFLHSVRAEYPEMPFILFTSEGSERVASKAVSARVTEYIIEEHFEEQWAELATLIEESISYHRSHEPFTDTESRAKVILDALVEPVLIVQDGAICYSNGAALATLDFDTSEALSGSNLIDRIAADFQTATATTLDAIQDGETRVDQLDVAVVGPEGTETPVELTTVSVEWYGTASILVLMRDITDRIEQKRTIDRERSFLQAVIEATKDAILVTNDDWDIVHYNDRFAEMWDLSRDLLDEGDGELALETVIDMVADQAAFRDMIQDLYEHPNRTMEAEVQLIDGRILNLYSTAVTKEGSRYGRQWNYTDITERRQREQQITVLQRILRHNLRNDLNVVIMGAEQIAAQTDDRAISDLAGNISRSATHLMEIAEKQREVSKILADPAPPQSGDLTGLLEAVIEDVQETHPHANIRLEPADVDKVTITPNVETAVTELLQNAAEHTDGEEPTIVVTARVRSDTVEIAVADDGPGISPDELRSWEAGEDPLHHGSGIGLKAVHWMAQRWGGSVSIEENEPEGSVVTLRVPREHGG